MYISDTCYLHCNFLNFYSITVVCLFSPSLHPTPAEPPAGSGEGTVGKGDYRNYNKGHMSNMPFKKINKNKPKRKTPKRFIG